MLKPGSLREVLTAALPEVIDNPDQLSIHIKEGTLVCTGVPGLSFEYRYQLTVLLTDFARHPDLVMVPLLSWVARHQPELLHNPDRRHIGFEVDLLDNERVDMEITLPLTEAVRVMPRDGGGYTAEHLQELDIEMALPQHWQLYLRDQLLLEWDVPAPHALEP